MQNKFSRTTVFISGGLGNQLFQIASALQFESNLLVINISQLRGEFELYQLVDFIAKRRGIQIVVESKNPPYIFIKAHNYLLRSTQWQTSRRVKELIAYLVSQAGIVISRLPTGCVYTDYNDFKKFESRIKSNQCVYVIGYFQNENIATSIRKDLTAFLDTNYIVNSLANSIDESLEIILHIRRGDYANENKIGMLSLRYFEKVLSKINQDSSISRIRLFTNGNFDLSRIIDRNEVSAVVEIDASSSAVELLAKMRNGQIFILSNSTLSWWAAYLSRNPKKQIHIPDPWFRTLVEPVNLIPADWNKCPAIWSEEKKS
jgi:hypothetical protein